MPDIALRYLLHVECKIRRSSLKNLVLAFTPDFLRASDLVVQRITLNRRENNIVSSTGRNATLPWKWSSATGLSLSVGYATTHWKLESTTP